MFGPITVPFETVMLFNIVKLKDGVSIDDVQMTLGELCSIVKQTYGNEGGGFVAGQVYKYAGFVSDAGTIGSRESEQEHLVIVTYWRSFDHHEKSHDDKLFKDKFRELVDYCKETKELGYNLLWQGEAK